MRTDDKDWRDAQRRVITRENLKDSVDGDQPGQITVPVWAVCFLIIFAVGGVAALFNVLMGYPNFK